jgi:IMP dehydrogenase
MNKIINEGLTFDDVLLVPSYSECLPNEVSTRSKLTRNISLKTPIIAAPMDTVTEAKMAIAMAIEGGMGILHKNLSHDELAWQIRKVKQYNNFIILDPITISPDEKISDAVSLMHDHNHSGVPVVDENKKLLGILTNRDLRFIKNKDQLVKNVMKSQNLITVKADVTYDEAMNKMHEHRIERLLVVNDEFQCIGLITMSDMQRINNLTDFTADKKGRPMVGVAIGINFQHYIEKIMAEEPDVVVLDSAHGHSKNMIEAAKHFKKMYPNVQLIAGNIATYEACVALVEAGVDAVKVGIGPGSICTTRIVTGVGVPQLTAIMDVRRALNDLRSEVALIADGGIKFSGDVSKAIAAGADSVMIGSLLASCEESAGDVVLYEGRTYKTYRGMGSIGAMNKGSSDRYFQNHINNTSKFVPEGVEGMVPMRGRVKEIIHNIRGGLCSAMGYTGNNTIKKMQQNAQMVRITNAGLKESHVHNITMTKETSNYSSSGS